MKKFTGFIAAAAIALAPMSSSALEALTDNALNDVTGQAGVSIVIDDVILETWVGATTYTDTDGNGDAVAGSIIVADKHTVKTFSAITRVDGGVFTSPGLGLANDTVTVNTDITGDGVADVFTAHALTIDVGTCSVYSDGASYNSGLAGGVDLTMTGVVIGLPTLEITTSADTYTVAVTQTGAHNTGAEYIQVTTGDKVQHILGGVLEIAPH